MPPIMGVSGAGRKTRGSLPIIDEYVEAEKPVLETKTLENNTSPCLSHARGRLSALMFLRTNWLMPLLVAHCAATGLQAVEIGVVTMTASIARGVAQTVGQGIADRSRAHRAIWVGALCVASAVILLFGGLDIRGFLPMVGIVSGYELCRAQAGPTLDALSTATLAEEGKAFKYGTIRMWLAVGYGTWTLLFSALVQHFGFLAAWIGFASLSIAEIMLVCSQDFSVLQKTDDGKESSDRGTMTWLQLVTNTHFNVFLGVALCYGCCSTAVEAMLVVFISTLSTDVSLVGWCIAVQCLSEIPWFFYADSFLQRIGPEKMITLSLVVFIIRAVSISYVSSAWMIIPLQLLHGNSFALFMSAAVEMSRRNAPTPQWQASAQGLLAFMYASVGGVCGNLLGGWLFNEYGGRVMYRLKAALACAAFLLWVLYNSYSPCTSLAPDSDIKENNVDPTQEDTWLLKKSDNN